MLRRRARSKAHIQTASGTVDRHAVMLFKLLTGSSHIWHLLKRQVTKTFSTKACVIHGFHVGLKNPLVRTSVHGN